MMNKLLIILLGFAKCEEGLKGQIANKTGLRVIMNGADGLTHHVECSLADLRISGQRVGPDIGAGEPIKYGASIDYLPGVCTDGMRGVPLLLPLLLKLIARCCTRYPWMNVALFKLLSSSCTFSWQSRLLLPFNLSLISFRTLSQPNR